MMYKIVYAFPKGYRIKKSILGIKWDDVVYKNGIVHIYHDLGEAKKDVARLKISGKRVKE